MSQVVLGGPIVAELDLALAGTALGGVISFTVGAAGFQVVTVLGDTHDQIASSIAAVVNADAALSSAGISATATNGVVSLSGGGKFTSNTVGDFGINSAGTVIAASEDSYVEFFQPDNNFDGLLVNSGRASTILVPVPEPSISKNSLLAIAVVGALAACTGFDWNESNGPKIWTKHEVSPVECEQAFFNLPVVAEHDEKHFSPEIRYYVLGQTDAGRRLFVVVTIREDLLRVISARDMSRKERKVYELL